MILEVHLDDFIRKTEHDSVTCSHPFFDINDILDASLASLDLVRDLGIRVGLLSAFEVASEVL